MKLLKSKIFLARLICVVLAIVIGLLGYLFREENYAWVFYILLFGIFIAILVINVIAYKQRKERINDDWRKEQAIIRERLDNMETSE